MSRFGKDVLIYATADVVGSSIGLILSPIFTRLYSPEQYGAQAILMAVWSFVGLAQFGGMDSAYPFFRSSTGDAAARRRLLVTASLVAVLAAFVVSGAFAAVGAATNWVAGFAGVSRCEVFAFACTLTPGALMAWFLYVLRYERRAMAFARVTLVGRVAGALFAIPALMWAVPEERLFIGFMVGAVVTSIAAVVGWWELIRIDLPPFSRRQFSRPDAGAMLRYGLVLIPASTLYAASTVVDRMLVTWFSGPAETAVLALALRLGAVAAMLRTWFALVWDPQLVDWIASIPRAALLVRIQAAAGVIAVAGAGLVCLATIWTAPIVALLYPAAYWPAAPLIPWIVLGVAVSGLSLIAVATIIIAKTPKVCLPVYGFGLVANIVAGVSLVPKMGAAGAVAGALIGEICILGAWICLGRFRNRNLPLHWARNLLLVGVAGAFAGTYRPGLLGSDLVWAERIAVSGVVLTALSILAVRRIRHLRAIFSAGATPA